jgi:cyclohexa-1,5-dienecarbonyl-CoA hydratase
MFVTPDATLGQPEMKLGVFAPAASCLLPELIGPQRAFDLLISGRSVSGSEAVDLGMALHAGPDPAGAALAYFDEQLKPKSAKSLRYAVRAARRDYSERIKTKLAALEALYLKELMRTRDAVEGLEAFMARRPAQWEHR